MDVGFASDEPEQLVNDRLGVQLLSGDEGEPLAQVKAHLMAEDRANARAGAIRLIDTFIKNAGQEIVEYSRDFEVNCAGMSVTTFSSTAWGQTRVPTFGDLTLSEQDLLSEFEQGLAEVHPIATTPRCGYWFEPDLEPGPVELLNLEN